LAFEVMKSSFSFSFFFFLFFFFFLIRVNTKSQIYGYNMWQFVNQRHTKGLHLLRTSSATKQLLIYFLITKTHMLKKLEWRRVGFHLINSLGLQLNVCTRVHWSKCRKKKEREELGTGILMQMWLLIMFASVFASASA